MNEIFEKVDAVLVKTPDSNFFYFTGLEGMWENSFAVVFPDKVEVIAPPLEKGDAHFYKGKKEMEKLLIEIVCGEKIGFDGKKLSYGDYKYLKKLLKCSFVDVGNEIKKMRLIKRRDEVEKIRRACRISLKVFEEIDFNNKREKEVSALIEYKFRMRDAYPAFNTIVAFGKNTSFPHHIPTNKKFVFPSLIDTGAKYKGYSSDITRSFVKRKGRKLYELIESILYEIINEMHAGKKANEIYEMAENFFNKYGYSMRHALGHSIGIDVHDGFSINKRSDFVLKENMVFAIEPAIYLKSYGLRIEEDVIVRKNRGEIIR
ncbi:MAG TPA: aminopeptidase P family protein [Thermoplasmatales archaeon]|nr:aminopeptidase P family protein [Thermoplasmatales archaeon]